MRAIIERKYVEVIKVADKKDPGIDRIAAGDLIGYFKRNGNDYAHVAMYAGDGAILCHTYCRSDLEECTWDNQFTLGLDNDMWEWRLLRFVDG